MNIKAIFTGIVLSAALAAPFASMARETVRAADIAYRHGSRHAQQNIVQAWQRISDAQSTTTIASMATPPTPRHG